MDSWDEGESCICIQQLDHRIISTSAAELSIVPAIEVLPA